MAIEVTTPLPRAVPASLTGFRRFSALPGNGPALPQSRPGLHQSRPGEPAPVVTEDQAPAVATAPTPPPVALPPAAPVQPAATAPVAPVPVTQVTAPLKHIPNKQPAPAGVDKWANNNALALGILKGDETADERKKKIEAYMKGAGSDKTDEASFKAQMEKDAIALQQKLKKDGLAVGPIDGKLGDLSGGALGQARKKHPTIASTPAIDLVRPKAPVRPAAAAAPVVPTDTATAPRAEIVPAPAATETQPAARPTAYSGYTDTPQVFAALHIPDNATHAAIPTATATPTGEPAQTALHQQRPAQAIKAPSLSA